MIETIRKMMAASGCIDGDVPLVYDKDLCVVVTAGGHVAAEGWRTVTEAKLYVALRNNAAALLDVAEVAGRVARGVSITDFGTAVLMDELRRALAALEVDRG